MQLRKRGKLAISMQKEIDSLNSRYKGLLDDNEAYVNEREAVAQEKRDKIDEIIELAARTETTIAKEQEELQRVVTALNQARVDRGHLQAELEGLEQELQDAEELAKTREQRRRRDVEKESFKK